VIADPSWLVALGRSLANPQPTELRRWSKRRVTLSHSRSLEKVDYVESTGTLRRYLEIYKALQSVSSQRQKSRTGTGSKVIDNVFYRQAGVTKRAPIHRGVIIPDAHSGLCFWQGRNTRTVRDMVSTFKRESRFSVSKSSKLRLMEGIRTLALHTCAMAVRNVNILHIDRSVVDGQRRVRIDLDPVAWVIQSHSRSLLSSSSHFFGWTPLERSSSAYINADVYA
jgi:hypothetical protein